MMEAKMRRTDRALERADGPRDIAESILIAYNNCERTGRANLEKEAVAKVLALPQNERAEVYTRLVSQPGPQFREAYKICSLPKIYGLLDPKDIVPLHEIVTMFKDEKFEVYFGGGTLQGDGADLDLLVGPIIDEETFEERQQEAYSSTSQYDVRGRPNLRTRLLNEEHEAEHQRYRTILDQLEPRTENFIEQTAHDVDSILMDQQMHFGNLIRRRHTFELDGTKFDLSYSNMPFTVRPKDDHVRL